jgi:hypothetical protein
MLQQPALLFLDRDGSFNERVDDSYVLPQSELVFKVDVLAWYYKGDLDESSFVLDRGHTGSPISP